MENCLQKATQDKVRHDAGFANGESEVGVTFK